MIIQSSFTHLMLLQTCMVSSAKKKRRFREMLHLFWSKINVVQEKQQDWTPLKTLMCKTELNEGE